MEIRTKYNIGQTVHIKETDEAGIIEAIYITANQDLEIEYTVKYVHGGGKDDLAESEISI